jgi:ACS family tartrate transporter-like MFS transporter
MFTTGPWSFYTLRILLGVAEAGFFPGIILYLSHWFPARERARAVATFMTAGVVTGLIGNPISGAIQEHMDGIGGLAGWQWVFMLEGIPAVVLGFVTLWYLTDRPEQAHWLQPEERDWLAGRIAREEQHRHERHGLTTLGAMKDPRVWLLVGVYFTVAMGDNAFGFFLGRFIKNAFPAARDSQVGLLAAVPSVGAIICMLLVGMHSDRTGERRWHVAVPAFVAALGWLSAARAPTPVLFLLALAVTSAGMKSMLPVFWSLPTAFLSGTAAAGGIALINSVANLGGSLAPPFVGWMEQTTGGFSQAMLVLAMVLCAGGVLVLFARHDATLDKGSPS